MHLERIGNNSILDLVSAPIPTGYKYFIIDIKASCRYHENWYGFDLDGLGDGHERLVDDDNLIIFSADNWKALGLFILQGFEDFCEAGDEVTVKESRTSSDVCFVQEAKLLVDELILLLLILKCQESGGHVAE